MNFEHHSQNILYLLAQKTWGCLYLRGCPNSNKYGISYNVWKSLLYLAFVKKSDKISYNVWKNRSTRSTFFSVQLIKRVDNTKRLCPALLQVRATKMLWMAKTKGSHVYEKMV